MADKKIKLGPLRRFALNIGFGILKSVIALIDDQLYRNFVLAQVAPLSDTVDVMTDRNPENLEQLETVFNNHKKKYALDSCDFIAGLIDRHVQNEDQKAAILGSIEALKEEVNQL